MILFLLILFAPFQLAAADTLSNVLIYTDPVQVTSSINAYENIVAGTPIQGTVMITHDSNAAIDASSFRMGDKPLQVTFVQSVPMSQYSNIVVTIYSFRLDGLEKGSHTLPQINVKVGDKVYQAPPLTVQVAS